MEIKNIKIMKRDGRVKEFDSDRVLNAIRKAYIEVYGSGDKFVPFARITEQAIENRVIGLDKDVLDVEEVQDIVIECLDMLNKDVSIAYSRYRKARTVSRNSKMSLIKEIEGLVNSTNIEVMTENSNKQAQLSSTQRDLIAGEVSKYISKTSLIPSHLIEAHMEGIIKIHDMDYFLQNIYNCELVNLEDMLQNGTVINKKLIEKPKSLRTAMTLATQISAQISSSTYGGQTITLTHLAPFVRISKEKITRKYESMNLPISKEKLEELIQKELKDEIKDAVQTFNYQISTLMTTNGRIGCLY